MSLRGPKRLTRARARRTLSVAFAAAVVAMAGPACNNLLNITQLALRSPDASIATARPAPATTSATDGGAARRGRPGVLDATGDDQSSDSGGFDGGNGKRRRQYGERTRSPGASFDDALHPPGRFLPPRRDFSCDGGTACVARGLSSRAGTPCGGDDAGLVCSNGSCVACTAGLDCSDAGSCQKMQISCGTGPQCTAAGNQRTGNVRAATTCTATADSAKPAPPGAACVLTANPCHTGTVSCSGGGTFLVHRTPG